MSKYKLFIFDAYGVTLNGGYPKTMKALAKKYNRDWKELYAIFYTKYFNMAATRKIPQGDAWKLAIKETNLPCTIAEAKALHYSFMSKNKQMAAFVDRMGKRMKTLLLSKNTRSQFSDAEKLMPFKHHFTYVINTWELGLAKAKKETIMYVAKKYNIKASEMIYVDDQKENLIEAKKLGVATIHFTSYADFTKKVNKLLGGAK